MGSWSGFGLGLSGLLSRPNRLPPPPEPPQGDPEEGLFHLRLKSSPKNIDSVAQQPVGIAYYFPEEKGGVLSQPAPMKLCLILPPAGGKGQLGVIPVATEGIRNG